MLKKVQQYAIYSLEQLETRGLCNLEPVDTAILSCFDLDETPYTLKCTLLHEAKIRSKFQYVFSLQSSCALLDNCREHLTKHHHDLYNKMLTTQSFDYQVVSIIILK